nr:helix-turn-helix domain-containing protein [Rickettsia tamurae]
MLNYFYNLHKLSDTSEKREQGIKIKNLMQEFNLSKATIYRYLAQEPA